MMATVLAQVEAILAEHPDAPAFLDEPHWSEQEWSGGLVAASLPPRRALWQRVLAARAR